MLLTLPCSLYLPRPARCLNDSCSVEALDWEHSVEHVHTVNTMQNNCSFGQRYCTLPPKLTSTLHQFQIEGVQFCLKNGGRLLIGDEMGLGKTVQALAISQCYADKWPVLVVTSSSLRYEMII